MNPNMASSEMISPSRAAGTLRSLVKALAQEESSVIVIGQEGVPQAVLVSFNGFRRLLEAAGEADATMVADRLASAPEAGEGLSNAALEQMVLDAEGAAVGGDTSAGGTGGDEGGPDADTGTGT